MRKLSFFGLIILLVAACQQEPTPAANLIVNGDGEMPKFDSVPPGWQNIQGHWVSFEEDSVQHDVVYAQHGKYIFFAGNDTLGILQQDIDVSAYAHGIDANKQQFIFNGYVQSLDQGANSDQSAFAIKGLDGSKSKVLYTFGDTTRSIGKWLPITDTFVAPVATRFIRIQMIAIRHVGGDNDGYFDNFFLTTRSLGSGLIWIWMAVAVLLIGVTIGVIKYRQKTRSAKILP